MSAAPGERRRDLRAPVSIMGTAEGPDGEVPVVVLNLSASGAMIQADAAPTDDATYTLRFSVHKRPYGLRFRVVHWLQQGDAFGWRGRFVEVSPDEAHAIGRAVHAAMGLTGSCLRPWDDVAAEAAQSPDAQVVVGTTPAGHDIPVLARDLLDMGADGLELYARLISELETI